jgi:hypothetical protein
MVSVLDAEDEWRAQLQQNFLASLGDALRDSDLLIQALLDSETDGSDVLPFLKPYRG